MSYMRLDKRGNVFVLTLTDGDNDNTFSPDVVAAYHEHLDKVEYYLDNTALVITSEHPKTFCNGINLTWLLTQSPESFQAFVHEMDRLLLRIATLGVPVIAAINGNCYAGGALLAAACDWRFMREDRGRFCFSEVNIKIPFTPLMMDIVKLLPAPAAVRDLTLTGRAVGGIEAQQLGIVDYTHSEATLLSEALAFAELMAEKHRATYAAIKKELKRPLSQTALTQPPV